MMSNEKTYIVPLEKGFHPLRLEYFEQSGDANLVMQYVTPGSAQPSPIPVELLYRQK